MGSRWKNLSLSVGLFLVSVLSIALANPPISPETLARLAGETSNKVQEIAEARQLASASGFELASYGGTSRELIDFVLKKARKLGGAAEYEAWLSKQESIDFIDWHRMGSDLDFQLIARNPGLPAAEAAKQFNNIQSEIARRFAPTAFYKTFDLNLSSEFFKKYDPALEHYEATSNIPLGEGGLVRIPQLTVKIDGKNVDLSVWGLEQFSSGKFDFVENVAKPSGDVFGDVRQVLRWIRYTSEEPEFELTPRAQKAIKDLWKKSLTTDRPLVKALFQGEGPDKRGKKIKEALEKLQLYSRNSTRTRRLLDVDFQITPLAEEAGVQKKLILTPLRQLPAQEREPLAAGKSPLGQEIVVRHRTSMVAAQNMEQGSLWISNGESEIGGKVMGAAHGPGLYASTEFGATSFGDVYVDITLSRDAVEGVDFVKHVQEETKATYYIIKNLNAIARNPDGSLKITSIARSGVISNLLTQLAAATPEQQKSIGRTIGTLVRPERITADLQTFSRLNAEKAEIRTPFLQAYYSRVGVASTLLTRANEGNTTNEPYVEFMKLVHSDSTDPAALTAKQSFLLEKLKSTAEPALAQREENRKLFKQLTGIEHFFMSNELVLNYFSQKPSPDLTEDLRYFIERGNDGNQWSLAKIIFSNPLSVNWGNEAALLAKKTDSFNLEYLAKYVLSQPHSAHWNEALKTVIERAEPYMVANTLANVFSLPHAKGWTAELKLAVEKADVSFLPEVVEKVFSKPVPPDWESVLGTLIKRADNYGKSRIAEKTFSQPFSAGWTKELNALLEDPDDGVLSSLIKNVFSKPHSAEWGEAFTRIVDRSDSFLLDELAKSVFSQPHSLKWKTQLETLLRKTGEYRLKELSDLLKNSPSSGNLKEIREKNLLKIGDARTGEAAADRELKFLENFGDSPDEFVDLINETLPKGTERRAIFTARLLSNNDFYSFRDHTTALYADAKKFSLKDGSWLVNLKSRLWSNDKSLPGIYKDPKTPNKAFGYPFSEKPGTKSTIEYETQYIQENLRRLGVNDWEALLRARPDSVTRSFLYDVDLSKDPKLFLKLVRSIPKESEDTFRQALSLPEGDKIIMNDPELRKRAENLKLPRDADAAIQCLIQKIPGVP